MVNCDIIGVCKGKERCVMVIKCNSDKVRIDKYLLESLDYSRNKIQKMIKEGYIKVEGKAVKNNYQLKLGQEIEIDTDYKEVLEVVAQDISLNIVYEDDYLLVVNKPSGMVVHPACGNYDNTLVNALMFHCNKLSQVNGEVRPGIVHRIDADTSGLLLVAKDDKVHVDLAMQIQNKTVLRKYLALVQGVIEEDTATIDAPIGRDKSNRKKMCITAENSKRAVTNLRVLERYDKATLIECVLETGRTHQIRVHMAYIGHPVVNDPVYGYKNVIDKDYGQMLHAETLGFVHPVTKEYLEFNCEPERKFWEILDKYRSER